MLKKYHGIIPPIITPVDARENVDESGYRQLLEYCVQGGLHGILVAGTNGETMALTQKERTRAIRITLEQINGRIPVMAGCMDTSTRRVIENIKAAQDVGLTCAAVTSVFYDRHTSQDETVRHFERILQETDIPELIIYNIPPAYNAARSGDIALTWKYDALLRESSKILGMTKNGTAAAKYAISLRGFTDKRVMWPQDFTSPEEEANIAKKVKEVDELYADFKKSLQ